MFYAEDLLPSSAAALQERQDNQGQNWRGRCNWRLKLKLQHGGVIDAQTTRKEMVQALHV
jgi:hypothetical protein